MANSYNTQILRDGYRNFVIRLTGEIDIGTSPTDIAPTQLTTVSTMNPPCLALRVDRVKFSLPAGANLDVQLYWQATTNLLFWGVAGGDENDGWNFGGLTNNASPGATGNIMWGTTGVTGTSPQAGNFLTFAVIVECTKLQVQYPK